MLFTTRKRVPELRGLLECNRQQNQCIGPPHGLAPHVKPPLAERSGLSPDSGALPGATHGPANPKCLRYNVASELDDPICHSNECQIGSFSSEATIIILRKEPLNVQIYLRRVFLPPSSPVLANINSILAYDVPDTEDLGLPTKCRFNVGPALQPIAGSMPVNRLRR